LIVCIEIEIYIIAAKVCPTSIIKEGNVKLEVIEKHFG